MTIPVPGRPEPEPDERSESDVRWNRLERRKERIRQGVHQARHGKHLVPTWLMAAILGLILAGWLFLIFTS